MSMNEDYRNAVAAAGAFLMPYVGLVDDEGVEIDAAPYERKPATWTVPEDGNFRLEEDVVFDIPAGVVVGGWSGYSQATEGTAYGGDTFTPEIFANPGTLTLLASGTGVNHTATPAEE